MQPTTSALLDRVGIVEGMRCLDVGSGGGDVSLELARRVGASGAVLGLDLDEAKLALAREEAALARIATVEYRNADIMTAELGADFDLVYARFLLTHLEDPAGAASILFGCLRPGAVLVVEDIDVSGSFCQPASDTYAYYSDVYTRTAHVRGGDPNIGPRLPHILLDAGCERVAITIVQPVGLQPSGHEGDVKLVSPLTLENIADAAIAEGLVTRDEIDRRIDDLYRLASDDRTLMSLPRIVQTWGYRPDSRQR
jgi:SAM-dependent methyltransferase